MKKKEEGWRLLRDLCICRRLVNLRCGQGASAACFISKQICRDGSLEAVHPVDRNTLYSAVLNEAVSPEKGRGNVVCWKGTPASRRAGQPEPRLSVRRVG